MDCSFLIKTNHEYPLYNTIIFEEYFYNYVIENSISLKRELLPIFWTNYYISNNYANGNMSNLQDYLKTIDADKKYATVVQWDDGILQDISHLDLLVFAQGGKFDKYQGSVSCCEIPLINQQAPNINLYSERDILAGFVGVIDGRGYYVREKMRDVMLGKKDVLISESAGYPMFKNVMERSVFSLCPRGHGQTSFRINEALQYGSIPVYVYDTPIIPWNTHFDFTLIGILVHISEIGSLYELLQSKTAEEIAEFRKNGARIYQEYFNFEGCAKKVIQTINSSIC